MTKPKYGTETKSKMKVDKTSYLVDDKVPSALCSHPEPLLKTTSSLLDENLPSSGQVLFARLSINLRKLKFNI